LDNALPETALKGLYRRPLFADWAGFVPAEGSPLPTVETRIPHRAPMCLLSRVLAVDDDAMRGVGELDLSPEDPVFAGHFPEHPIYPGVLQIEAIGQLGLYVGAGSWPLPRVVRIVDARFLREVGPGETLHIQVAVVDQDPLMGRLAGQIWVGQRLCSAAILELYLG
jgi:3-hydroxyacyl-[acyl-carrier-protein] dehydratase